MAKRVPTSSSIRPKKHKVENHLADMISLLPDEILVLILSLLTMKEAVRTSVLSKRWMHLWKYITGGLDFDALKTLYDERMDGKFLRQERPKYVNWVNKVLNIHQGHTLSNFRVQFDLNDSFKCDVDRWIEFAITKRVQRLELDFTPVIGGCGDRSKRYTFPNQIYLHIRSPHGLCNIKSLRSLCFRAVNVTGELLQYFISSCPLLEELCVSTSEHLLNLKVAGSSLQLKHLDIRNCHYMVSIEICAPKLVSFKYSGPKTRLDIENVPSLVDVTIGGQRYRPITDAFGVLSHYLSQLEILTLETKFMEIPTELVESIRLPSLKHLTLSVVAHDDDCLFGWTSLIKASPLLHTFKLELLVWLPVRVRRKVQKAARCLHTLKVIEFVGFVGRVIDTELVTYLIENATVLEKVIIDRRSPWSLGKREFKECYKKRVAQKRALQLQRILPPGAKLYVV